MKLITKNKINDKIDLIQLISLDWFDKTSCDHGAKSLSFLFQILPNLEKNWETNVVL